MIKIRLRNSTSIIPLDFLEFKKENDQHFFILTSSENINISIIVNYNLPVKSDYQKENFNCIPFITPTLYKENHIFEVHIDTNKVGRVGWIFPIQALVSDEHSYSDNPHFLKYSFVTFYKLLSGNFFEEDILVDIDNVEVEIQLSDIYPSDLSVLCLSNDKTALIPEFNIVNYLHSFYVYKFFLCQNPNEIVILEKEDVGSFPTKIKLLEISKELKDEIYILSLYKNHLKSKNHPLVQFHFLYQIIELIINRIFDCEIKKIMEESIRNISKTPYAIGTEIKAITSEANRIKKMHSTYLSKRTEYDNNLISSCNSLLKYFDIEKKNVGDAFYEVRNIVVHNFRKITSIDNNFSMLKSINKDFEVLLSEVLSNYTEPSFDLEESNLPTAWLVYQSLNQVEI